MDQAKRASALSILERLMAAVNKHNQDELNLIFNDQKSRDLLFAELEAQRAALHASLMTALRPAHTNEGACRRQVEDTPAYRAMLHKETILSGGNLAAGRLAIEILKTALGLS